MTTDNKKSHLFQKGQSGNPAGRPKGKKNQLTNLKQDLEIAVRDHLRPGRITQIVDAMCKKAIEEGNVGAAKLILDKVVSNATDTDDSIGDGQALVFKVQNLTLKQDDTPEVIDVTPTKEADSE